MTGVGVELLVEPWELGPRKAKEFLLCASTIDAAEAERLGLVNRVVPRAELDGAARAMAEEVALVPPVTAQAMKESINQMVDLIGPARQRGATTSCSTSSCRNTPTALAEVDARKQGGMDAVRREQAGQ